jgi:hypothetical protein
LFIFYIYFLWKNEKKWVFRVSKKLCISFSFKFIV